jgi:hypothetical protein
MSRKLFIEFVFKDKNDLKKNEFNKKDKWNLINLIKPNNTIKLDIGNATDETKGKKMTAAGPFSFSATFS